MDSWVIMNELFAMETEQNELEFMILVGETEQVFLYLFNEKISSEFFSLKCVKSLLIFYFWFYFYFCCSSLRNVNKNSNWLWLPSISNGTELFWYVSESIAGVCMPERMNTMKWMKIWLPYGTSCCYIKSFRQSGRL